MALASNHYSKQILSVEYIYNYLQSILPSSKINTIDIALDKNYSYDDSNSPLHNSVAYLNHKLIRHKSIKNIPIL